MQNLIKLYFTETIQTEIVIAESLSHTLEKAANSIVTGLLGGQKILGCADGFAISHVQNFTSKLMANVDIERPGIPAIALSPDSMSYSFGNDCKTIYSRQIQTLGQKGDVFIVLASHNEQQAIIHAVQEAVIHDMTIIALTGCDGGEIVGLLGENDIEIRIPSYKRNIIDDMHLIVLGCLYQLIENLLFIHDK